MRDKIAKITNLIALLLTGGYLLFQINESCNTGINTTGLVMQLIQIGLIGCAGIKILFDLMDKKYRQLITKIVLIIVSYYATKQTDNDFMLFICSSAVALSNVSEKKALNLYFCVVGIYVLTMIILCWSGFVGNVVYFDGARLRSSWGILYPTNFAAIIFFLAMIMWLRYRECNEFFLLIPVAISIYISKKIAVSSTSLYCGLLLIFMILIDIIAKFLNDKDIHLNLLRRIWHIFMCLSLPFFVLVTWVCTYLWHLQLPISITINNILHDRIRLLYEALIAYRIHPFGTMFTMVGQSGSFLSSGNPTYNYLDNSFGHIIIRYGWVPFVILVVLWYITMYRAYKKHDYRIPMVMSVIAFNSLSEQHFFDLSYNILLLYPFLKLDSEEEKKCDFKQNISLLCTILIGGLVGLITLPVVIRKARTIANLNNLVNTSSYHLYVPIIITVIIIVACLVIIYFIYKIILSALNHEFKWKKCIVSGVLVLALCITTYIGDINIGSYHDTYAIMMIEEEEVVNLIKDNKQGNLYANDVPEYYQEYIGGFTDSILKYEEFAQKENTTIITKAEDMSSILESCGFQWAQISSEHAVYTNDQNVIDTLNKNGYTVTACNQYIYEVDMEQMAEYAGLKEENGVIHVDSENPLIRGPQNSLYAGNYYLKMHLSDLKTNNVLTNDTVAIIHIKYWYGEGVISDTSVYLNDFEDEYCDLTISFYSGGYRGVLFEIEPQEGVSFDVSNMTYQRYIPTE